MNLEKVLSELKVLKSSTASPMIVPIKLSETVAVGQQPESITAGMSFKAPSSGASPIEKESEVYGYVPQKKKKEDEEDEPHLMKPSDLFK